MRAASAILRNLSLRRIQPSAAVVPLPATTQFSRELTAELDTLQSQGNIDGELGLAQLLDASITTQKIALNSLVNICYIDEVDHGAMEEYLENNIDILDACNYFVERIEDTKKYVDLLRIVAHLVDTNATSRALEHLESCYDIEKRSKTIGKRGFCLKKMLRQKHETEFGEIVCGSKAMALMCCKFLELGLSFDSKSGLPLMKECHTMSSSWLRVLAEQAEGSAEKKKRRFGSLMIAELKQTVAAARELKEHIKGKGEKEKVKFCVDRLKRCCSELEDGLDFIEGKVKDLYKSLIDVRMALLGIISQA
ncbi:hypothetical protein VNO77_33379 [Canavalia gladiata]|uniref:Uncharacterized protein n=1 Tax=Canavalia gladiata TaxID=3824 RepID=A0AAN9KDN1_CANGL